MFVAGVDGCGAGWVAFKVEVPSLMSSLDVVHVAEWLSRRPDDLLCLAIDIPIGLLDCSRPCDKAARKLLGQPRGSSVFAAPSLAALSASRHSEASEINRQRTTRGLSQQAWGIAPKIRQVDDAITLDCQRWAFEVHPEVCFWALNESRPIKYNKKSKDGSAERVALLRRVSHKLKGTLRTDRLARADDLLDAAAAAWSALRLHEGEAQCVCPPVGNLAHR